jgi:hypothetical protein
LQALSELGKVVGFVLELERLLLPFREGFELAMKLVLQDFGQLAVGLNLRRLLVVDIHRVVELGLEFRARWIQRHRCVARVLCRQVDWILWT